jgi:hypothetical protein
MDTLAQQIASASGVLDQVAMRTESLPNSLEQPKDLVLVVGVIAPDRATDLLN